ncbi:magnesium transporter [Syntrophus gentianae]|uniref:Magnesium transport protein CorA n=1 Tax=Syntrophus gentianae TaxID=43775 RepID=A0A1H7W434_9BACT|nr:magnesium/cobalt transporter CorA [Syntrophus gentianae]SEM15815.1 magnesium transporter [Syntrophus gentianae]
MPRTKKTRSAKVGLPPGSLVHVGEKLSEKSKISLIHYDELSLQEMEIQQISGCASFLKKTGVNWISFQGLPEIPVLEELGLSFGLHPLTLEDILNTDQRPKMEDYGDYLYIVLRMFHPESPDRGELKSEQISILFGANFVLSFEEKDTGTFETIRERIRNTKGRLRKSGPDSLAHALMDAVVDHYFLLLENLEERIEGMEEDLVKAPSAGFLNTLQGLKKKMILLRKSLWPLREMITSLERSESPLINKSTLLYVRDIYDHTIHIIDTLETFRDMLSGMLDIYLSTISNRMNEVMKVLTVIATLFMPLTFVAGIYGMNFKYMPELEWRWGYAMAWVLMLAIAGGMLLYFRKKNWW